MNNQFTRVAPIGALSLIGSQAHAVNKQFTRVAPIGALALIGSQAHAALPTEVTDAITTAGTDMVTAVTAIIVAFVAFWGLKKLGSKLGWL